MAFDGIVIAGLVHELNQTILNTKISKIAQPENDELLLTCKGSSGQFRVSISANASLPFLYLTDTNKTSPLQAPTFCMVLRKHIANGRIISITQPHMERIIHLKIEHLNEMGDICHKTLVIELMGKHSNIIFCDEDGTMIDSIKHVSSAVSSLREVLPGRPYFIPATQEDKFNAMTMDATQICDAIKAKPMSICKAIYTTFTGVSPLVASELAFRAGMDARRDGCRGRAAVSSGAAAHALRSARTRKQKRLCRGSVFFLSCCFSALRALEILAHAGVDADAVAGVDEQRHLDLSAGLEGGGLGGVGGRVAGEARIGVGHFELDERGRLDQEHLALVGADDALHVLLHEAEVAAERALVDGNELVGLGIHEVVKVAVVIAVLHIL